MLTKIISGGQTGADRAALDVAIALDIPHAGWIPKGRKTEDGILPDKYQLKEMPTASYPKRTEKNVIDSDGTLILSHGKLSGGSALTVKMAMKHGRPHLHVDFLQAAGFAAGHAIKNWISKNRIRVLNVAGSRSSKDQYIYRVTVKVLRTVFHLSEIDLSVPNHAQASDKQPKTVDEAVDRLISELPLKDKTKLSKMDKWNLSALPFTIGQYIREKFGLGGGNDELMQSCLSISGENDLHEETASAIIIEALWERLKQTHGLRVVK